MSLLRQGTRCAGRDAAVHQQGLAGDVGAGVGCQEHYRAIQILRLAGTLERDAVAEVFDPFVVLVHDGVLLGLEPAWSQAIHGDAVGAPIVGESHGELLDAAPAGAIRPETGVPGDTGNGTNVNNATVFLRYHLSRDGL